jgi:transcription elongation factor Elf1
MIDFGLKPCPLCGGEPTVEHLAQGPEQLRAVIKCSGCGLTLDWETEIKVGISRSGKRTPVKAGLDPIEAWNRRNDCECCGAKIHSDMVMALHDCNDCGAKAECQYIPRLGEMTRINCPHWKPEEEKA